MTKSTPGLWRAQRSATSACILSRVSGVESGERFVEQEELWLSDEGACEGDALGLAAREGAGPGVGVSFQPDFTERGDGHRGPTTGAAAR